jgi:ABC-type proline/glycine betaine transport system permease subunit
MLFTASGSETKPVQDIFFTLPTFMLHMPIVHFRLSLAKVAALIKYISE